MNTHKKFNVCGIGNGLVDILMQVPEDFFATLGMERGGNQINDNEQQFSLLKKCERFDAQLVSGGSVANSMIVLAQLGGKGAQITCLGDDRYGLHYEREFRELGIAVVSHPLHGQSTGTVVSVITPDGERTMRFCLGAAARLGKQFVQPEAVASSQWLFVEGYLLANPADSLEAVQFAIDVARKSGTKVALTLSEAWVVSNFRAGLDKILPQVDLLFANEKEAQALSGEADPKKALRRICSSVPAALVSAGADGLYANYDGEEFHAAAFPCEPLDMTGAGDALAGAFLYGITNGFSPRQSATCGCYLAREVIVQIGARLQTGVKELWAAALEERPA